MTADVPLARIVGAGPVALACALFLVRRGVPARRLVLDPAPAPGAAVPPALAARALALSHGGCQLLARVAMLPPAGRIGRVEVSMLGHAGRTRIVAADLRVPELGVVVRYGALLEALRRAAAAHAWAPPGPDTPTPLTIHAEGDPGESADVREFHQSALLGEVYAPHAPAARQTVAFERFTPNGPLALLPLPEPDRWTLVWCDFDAATRTRATRTPAELADELQERFGDTLGRLRVEGPLAVAPLARRTRRAATAPGEVWIGNAAQALHPVAGQGLNLGIRDAFELADAVAESVRRGTPTDTMLRDWARARRADRSLTVGLTDLMAASFTWPLARGLQSPLLGALDLLPALRRPLAAQLMFGRR